MGILSSHDRQSELFAKYADSLGEFYKFAFVRDPLARFVSAYQWRQIEKSLPEAPHSTDLRRLRGISIEECAAIVLNEPEMFMQHLAPQAYYIEDRKTLDFVGRYENLASDWSKVCRAVRAPVVLPHLNRSVAHGKVPQSVLVAVKVLYAADYAAFGYAAPGSGGIVHGAIGIAHAVTGTGGASAEMVNKRTAVCRSCEHWNGMQCRLCGCLTWAKVRNAGESCPDGRWGAESPAPPAP